MTSNRFAPLARHSLTGVVLLSALALAACDQKPAEQPASPPAAQTSIPAADQVDTTAQTVAEAEKAQTSAEDVARYNKDQEDMAGQAHWMELSADDGSKILVAFREDEGSGNRYLDLKLDGNPDSPPVTLGAVGPNAYGDGDALTAVVSDGGGKVELTRTGGAKKTYN
ncbi:MAG: hypothetical protein Q4G70_05045 [Pseudomonadota bacterium]|nr:hypothetical protein [Pseudomonadota bacterium]